MSYTDLTDNQKLGIQHNATHNGRTVEEYTQWRLEQDADRGYQDYIKSGLASITAKLMSEPTILTTVEATADTEIEKIQAEKEAEAKLAEEEVIKEV